MLHHTCQFKTMYRRKESTFNNLLGILWDDIIVNVICSLASTEGNAPIFSELIVVAGFQYLTDVSPTSIMLVKSVSIASLHIAWLICSWILLTIPMMIVWVFVCYSQIACYTDMLRIGIICLRMTVCFTGPLYASTDGFLVLTSHSILPILQTTSVVIINAMD